MTHADFSFSGSNAENFKEDFKVNDIQKTKGNGTARQPVRIIVRREFVGTQTLTEAFIPVIYDDIRSQVEADTFDREEKIA